MRLTGVNAGTVHGAQVEQGPPIRGKGDLVEAAPVRFRWSVQSALPSLAPLPTGGTVLLNEISHRSAAPATSMVNKPSCSRCRPTPSCGLADEMRWDLNDSTFSRTPTTFDAGLHGVSPDETRRTRTDDDAPKEMTHGCCHSNCRIPPSAGRFYLLPTWLDGSKIKELSRFEPAWIGNPVGRCIHW